MAATTPPLRSELGTHVPLLLDVRSASAHPNVVRELRLDAPAPTQQAFSTKGRVPVATTILLFTIVGALIAFIAIAN